MIILKNLKLKNFLSHAHSEVEFEDNVKLSIEGVSGSGKSSIVEGLLWCLFGKGRADNRSMIKRGATKGAVIVELMDGETLYKITREVSEKGKQNLDIERKIGILDWEPVSKTGIKDAQDYIEKELLKSSYLLFINSVVYPQDNIESFVKQTAAKRKELLLEIVGAESYDLYYNKARTLASMTGEKISRVTGELDIQRKALEEAQSLAKNLPEYLENEKTLKGQLAFMEEEDNKAGQTRSDMAAASTKKSLLDLKIENEQKNHADLKVQRERLVYSDQNAAPQMDEMDIDLKIAELDGIEKQIEEIVASEKLEADRKGRLYAIIADKPTEIDYDKEIEALEAQKTRIESSTDTFCVDLGRACPKLQRQVDENTQYYKDQIEAKQLNKLLQSSALESYTNKLMEIGPEITYDAKKLSDLRVQASSLTKYRSEKDRLVMVAAMRAKLALDICDMDIRITDSAKTIIDLVSERMPLLNVIADLQNKMAEIKDYSVQIKVARDSITTNAINISMAQKAQEKVDGLLLEIAEKKHVQEEETEKMEDLILVKEAFGPTGIKSVVIDYILPGLEEKINEVLRKLSNFKITLDTQRKSVADDKMIEGLFINIYNDQGEVFDYDSYSGGQKNRVAYALFEGLASIQKCNFRIFDESIAGLDTETISAFADVMLQLNQEDRQVLCVSHIREIQDIFTEKLQIVNINGESKIL